MDIVLTLFSGLVSFGISLATLILVICIYNKINKM